MARKVHESHYQNFPHMFRGGLPDALEFGDLTSFDEEPLIGATSRKQFFGGFCRCVNCLHSVSNESLKLPCWYRSRDADGFIVKRILLNDVVHSQVLFYFSQCIYCTEKCPLLRNRTGKY